LQSGLSTSGAALATLAGRPPLSRQHQRPTASASAKSALSATSASTGPGGQPPASARGPARRCNSRRFFGLPLWPPRLLPALRPVAALAPAAFLFVRLPSGITTGAATRSPSPGTPAAGRATAPVPAATAAWQQFV